MKDKVDEELKEDSDQKPYLNKNIIEFHDSRMTHEFHVSGRSNRSEEGM